MCIIVAAESMEGNQRKGSVSQSTRKSKETIIASPTIFSSFLPIYFTVIFTESRPLIGDNLIRGPPKMDSREDVKSILPFLPLVLRSSSLSWPSAAATEALEALSKGPKHSYVDSGVVMADALTDIRLSLGFPKSIAASASKGYALFFDKLLPRNDSDQWFQEVLPFLARLLLQLPSLLEKHWQQADCFSNAKGCQIRTGLRLLEQQEAGIVVLNQELIGALLACSFFCLFRTHERTSKQLPTINFDYLFGTLYENYSKMQESKVKCIVHYFGRICTSIPKGSVSFERKVLPLQFGSSAMSYPTADFWRKSDVPLCRVEVHHSGRIEDHSGESLKVDFANAYIGGGAIRRGCIQEEILFMIHPELIVSILFLLAMAENESIKMVGVERFSNYTGYASSFRFSGDYVDVKDFDCFGRRKTRFIAIDALSTPGKRQYMLQFVLREINKAFCGFSNGSIHAKCEILSNWSDYRFALPEDRCREINYKSNHSLMVPAASLNLDTKHEDIEVPDSEAATNPPTLDQEEGVQIVTGNWGCGAFGGDPQLKTMLQWLAASQAVRPSMVYYAFGSRELENLEKVTEWILLHQWTVGDLWNMLEEYSTQRFNEETRLGFFSWLLPSYANDGGMATDSIDTE
ncbi:hypothetical protein SAY87_014145 [Trapa incisa]|uniref:poly(ADP-ribose) glycohydrolase n=1 Tax=Trapa incisa TaxID=236973 RepID=A0AAN7GS84_9MYRT|nr:hypothetical protein SAY87_014145 [Trapa incisa]